MEQHQGNAPPPAAKEDIEGLPKIKVTQAMVNDGIDCAVCKEDLVLDEQVTTLPCKHSYHFECVSKWLEAHDVSTLNLISQGRHADLLLRLAPSAAIQSRRKTDDRGPSRNQHPRLLPLPLELLGLLFHFWDYLELLSLVQCLQQTPSNLTTSSPQTSKPPAPTAVRALVGNLNPERALAPVIPRTRARTPVLAQGEPFQTCFGDGPVSFSAIVFS